MTEADYADDLKLLRYTPTQAESLLQIQGSTAGGIDFYVNANKT